MIIERAQLQDSGALSELCFNSKSHWGYSEDQMEEWRSELIISQSYILTNQVYKLSIGDTLIAFYSYFPLEIKKVFLDNLFIDPEFIGRGYGKILMDDFLVRIMSEKYTSIVLHADPHAENFYKRRGFKTIGHEESNIKGRFLPIMELQL